MRFPNFVVKEVGNTFDVTYHDFIWFMNPIYKLDNKLFVNTILEAYEVYIKYDGIYVKFVSPNELYVHQYSFNKEEQRILSAYQEQNGYYYDEYYRSYVCDYLILLKSFEKWINSYNNLKVNKYGELPF